MLIQRCINVVQRYFDVASTLFRRCFNVGVRRCINVVQRWKTDVGFCFIFNVESTLFQRWSTTLKQRWSDVEMLAGWGSFRIVLGKRPETAETVLLHKISTPGKGWTIFAFFYVRVSFHGHWQFRRQHRKKGDHPLFLITISIRTQSFRHLFATLYVRWLPRIFYRITCNYQTVSRWDLLPLRICIWLFFYGMLASF